jgi:CPA1 family monovalent cation:H+ antiporter
LLTLVESESLLNDAVAACLLSLVPLWLSPDGLALSAITGLLATEVGLALVLGLIAGGVLNVIEPRLRQPPLESVLHLGAAIGMAHLAQLGHASPVLTTVVAGLVVAARRNETSTGHWDALLSYGHLSNTLIFLWIGWWGLPQLPPLIGPVTVVLLVIWLARAVAIYPLAGLFHRTPRPLPMAYQHILVVGSLRGALALALVLPTAAAIGAKTQGPPADLLVAVVALSVILQGLAIQPLLRRLDLLPRRTVIA